MNAQTETKSPSADSLRGMVREWPLRIEVRPLLTSGGCGSGPATIFIYLADDQNAAEAAKTLWHEIVHVLMMAGGHTVQDEETVERTAQKLAEVCPEVLSLCGVSEYFPNA